MGSKSVRRRKAKGRARPKSPSWPRAVALLAALLCLLWLVGPRKDRVTMDAQVSALRGQAETTQDVKEETRGVRRGRIKSEEKGSDVDGLVCLSYEVYGKGKFLLMSRSLIQFSNLSSFLPSFLSFAQH